jgi:hypothetical protein
VTPFFCPYPKTSKAIRYNQENQNSFKTGSR